MLLDLSLHFCLRYLRDDFFRMMDQQGIFHRLVSSTGLRAIHS